MNPTFIHPHAICESKNVGVGTRVWAFAHVLPDAIVGNDCNICDHVFIENDVRVGDRVTVKCGVQLWDGVSVEDDVFIGPNVTFTNDIFPRSKQHPEKYAKTVVRKGASIGANATLLPGLEIGAFAMIGAGAVVTRSVPAHAIVVGNPATIVGYSDTKPQIDTPQVVPRSKLPPIQSTSVQGVTLHRLRNVEDMRGSLSVAELGKDVPFDAKRFFLVYDVPSREVRGEHAHLACKQFMVVVKGSVRVVADDGTNREEFLLDQPSQGLYLPPMVWGIQYRYSSDAVLLVMASEHYDEADYVRDYDSFLRLHKEAHRKEPKIA